MPLVWNDQTMNTGVPEIDAQHRELFARIDGLIAAMSRGDSRAEVERLVPFLADYAAWHFRGEEECMNAYRCPAAQANRQAHTAFLRMFSQLAQQIEREGPTLSLTLRLQREVTDWLRNHIVKVDTHLRRCVQGEATA